MGQMDMNESPSVVLVVRSGGTTSRVLSAHEDERAAAYWIGDEALAGRLPAGPIALERCPAPFLAQRPAAPSVSGSAPMRTDELEAIAGVIDRNLPGVSAIGHERAMAAARAVHKVVAQRLADARSMARQDASEADRSLRVSWSRVLGVPLVEGMPAAWQVLTEHARTLRDLSNDTNREPYVLADLRDILADAQHDRAAVHGMRPSELLDLVRSLVEAANTSPAPGGSAAHPEGVERVARALAGQVGEALDPNGWANMDGRDQQEYVRRAEFVVEAFLDTPGWED